MLCPTHKTTLKPLGPISLVCPVCEHKEYRKNKHWLPEVRHIVKMPSGFSWSTFTLTGCEVSSDTIIMSAGQTSATAVSPQISNLTKLERRKKDVTKVKIVTTETANDGKVQYAGSNDGGSNYRVLNTQDATFRLNHGNEIGFKQTKYSDLRIKITLTRSSAGDTSPVVSTMLVTHNYKGEGF